MLYCGVVYASVRVCVCVCVPVLDLACMRSWGQRFGMALTHCTLVQQFSCCPLASTLRWNQDGDST